MEGFDLGGHFDSEPPELALLRNQKALIEERERQALVEKNHDYEIKRLRREIRAKGEKPCA